MNDPATGLPLRAAAWHAREGSLPLVAAAIHDGHAVREEVERYLALDEDTRLREEDPYTRLFTWVAPHRIIGLRSRFEVDLNRPRDEAICGPEDDCWGLDVWREPPPPDVVRRSLALHDDFYSELGPFLSAIEQRHGGLVVLDIHGYNHRREGRDAPPADPAENPDVNVGTGSLDRGRWGHLLDRFLLELRDQGLDARENVKFKGRRLAASVHETFPETGCCLAIEFKKTFMDEWSGELDPDVTQRLFDALAATVPGLMDDLRGVLSRRRRARTV
jgi:N-formylglutamate amidohydrolase